MVEVKRAAAYLVVDDRTACGEAWMCAGYAVEFALKAYIMRRERLNGWPDKDSRPELYTHEIRKLFILAGLDLKTAPLALRGAVRMVLDWNRSHEYVGGRTSRAYARGMVEAAFGSNKAGGVVGWLKTLP